MKCETVLPKNIRQIGEIQRGKRIYLEDYVITFLRRKEKELPEGTGCCAGILLGSREQGGEETRIFIRGAVLLEEQGSEKEKRTENGETAGRKGRRMLPGGKQETEGARREDEEQRTEKAGREKRQPKMIKDAEEERRQPEETEEAEWEKRWNESWDTREDGDGQGGGEKEASLEKGADWWGRLEEEWKQSFPDSQLAGCFVMGILEEEKIQEMMRHFAGMDFLIFHVEEGEETVYLAREDAYERLTGYFIFYEQNPRMQRYMTEHCGKRRVEQEEGNTDAAITSFRKKVEEKTQVQRGGVPHYLAGSFLTLTVLLLGITIVNNYDKMKRIEAVIAQMSAEQEAEQTSARVLPAEGTGADPEEALLKAENSTALEANAAGEQAAEESLGEPAAAGGELRMQTDAEAEGKETEGDGTETGGAAGGQSASGADASGGTGGQSASRTDTSGGTGDQSASGTDASGGTGDQTASGTDAAGGTGDQTASGTAETLTNPASAAGLSAEEEQRGGNAESGAMSGEEQAQAAASQSVLEDWQQELLNEQGTGNGIAGNSLSARGLAERNYSAEEALPVDQTAGAGGTDVSGHSVYTIKYGDTLADISVKYYGSLDMVEEICRMNQIEDANLIVPGEKIVLP